MRYQKIHSQIWSDEKFIKLSEQARYLFLYILTSPHSNGIGVYVLPPKYIECDLNWSSKQLTKPFQELLRSGLILYDKTVNLICIKNHLKHNPIENENQAKSASKIISSLPKSSLYSIILKQLVERYHKPLNEALNILYAYPETETETEKETETEIQCEWEDKFELFWKSYPKKKSKGDAKKSWNKIKPDEELFKKIIDKINILQNSHDWLKENGKYIPHPATWLNREGWEDEPTLDPKHAGLKEWAAEIMEDEYGRKG